jgi:hypothetical protein
MANGWNGQGHSIFVDRLVPVAVEISSHTCSSWSRFTATVVLVPSSAPAIVLLPRHTFKFAASITSIFTRQRYAQPSPRPPLAIPSTTSPVSDALGVCDQISRDGYVEMGRVNSVIYSSSVNHPSLSSSSYLFVYLPSDPSRLVSAAMSTDRTAGRAETTNEDSSRNAGTDLCSTNVCRGACEVKASIRGVGGEKGAARARCVHMTFLFHILFG